MRYFARQVGDNFLIGCHLLGAADLSIWIELPAATVRRSLSELSLRSGHVIDRIGSDKPVQDEDSRGHVTNKLDWAVYKVSWQW